MIGEASASTEKFGEWQHPETGWPSLAIFLLPVRAPRSARWRFSAGLLRRRAQENDSALVTEHREKTIAVLRVMQRNHKGLSIR